jgi:Uma2 family endonuclease
MGAVQYFNRTRDGEVMSLSLGIDNNPPITIPKDVTSTLSAFREWAGDNDLPENAKVFFYRGEVWVEMGRQQLFTHVDVKTEVTSVLYQLVKGQKSGNVFSDGVLVTNEEAELSGNPDMVFVSLDSRSNGRITFVEGKEGGYVEILGSPDMVMEVVSDSSEKKDNQTLFEAYYEAEILEYWLVDARGDDLEFQIYKRGPTGYVPTRKQSGWLKSAVFGKSFRLIRGKDATGNPEFTLELK